MWGRKVTVRLTIFELSRRLLANRNACPSKWMLRNANTNTRERIRIEHCGFRKERKQQDPGSRNLNLGHVPRLARSMRGHY
jgi:hypothetical protein